MAMPPPPGYGWPPPQPLQPKKRHIVRNVLLSTLGVFVLLIVIAAIVGGGETRNPAAGGQPVTNVPAGSPATTSKATAAAPKKPTPATTVGRGYGSEDASADVKLTSCADTGGYGLVSGKLAIVNHSPGRSDYFIDVTFLDAAGTNIGSGFASASAVEGGQRATADLVGSVSGKLATCKVITVQRTAS
jgi:hypothetical protein